MMTLLCGCAPIMKLMLCILIMVGHVTVVQGLGDTFVQLVCEWEAEHSRQSRSTDVPRQTHIAAALRRQKRHDTFQPTPRLLYINDQQGRIRKMVVESAIRNGNLDVLLSRRKRMFDNFIPDPIQTTTVGGNVAQRSMCPWSNVVDTNSSRVPRRITKAVCDSTGGRHSGATCNFPFPPGVPNSAQTQMLSRTACLPVTQEIEVVVECCNNGQYSLHYELIPWQVSCACARRTT